MRYEGYQQPRDENPTVPRHLKAADLLDTLAKTSRRRNKNAGSNSSSNLDNAGQFKEESTQNYSDDAAKGNCSAGVRSEHDEHSKYFISEGFSNMAAIKRNDGELDLSVFSGEQRYGSYSPWKQQKPKQKSSKPTKPQREHTVTMEKIIKT